MILFNNNGKNYWDFFTKIMVIRLFSKLFFPAGSLFRSDGKKRTGSARLDDAAPGDDPNEPRGESVIFSRPGRQTGVNSPDESFAPLPRSRFRLAPIGGDGGPGPG